MSVTVGRGVAVGSRVAVGVDEGRGVAVAGAGLEDGVREGAGGDGVVVEDGLAVTVGRGVAGRVVGAAQPAGQSSRSKATRCSHTENERTPMCIPPLITAWPE